MTAGTIEIRNPADGSVVGSIPTAGEDEIDTTVGLANRSWPGWARTPATERGALLHTAAARLRAHADDLAALNEAETGRPRDEAREGVLAGAGTLDQYA